MMLLLLSVAPQTARDRSLQAILDMHLGWADPLTEIRAFGPFLRGPLVHVAIDYNAATGTIAHGRTGHALHHALYMV